MWSHDRCRPLCHNRAERRLDVLCTPLVGGVGWVWWGGGVQDNVATLQCMACNPVTHHLNLVTLNPIMGCACFIHRQGHGVEKHCGRMWKRFLKRESGWTSWVKVQWVSSLPCVNKKKSLSGQEAAPLRRLWMHLKLLRRWFEDFCTGWCQLFPPCLRFQKYQQNRLVRLQARKGHRHAYLTKKVTGTIIESAIHWQPKEAIGKQSRT